MVRWILPLLVILCLVGPVQAEPLDADVAPVKPELRLELKRTTLEQGKPLFATLVYQGTEQAAQQAFVLDDWMPLSALVTGDVSGEEGERRLSLRLYPRRSGELILPALAHGGAILKPVALRVTEPRRKDLSGGIRLLESEQGEREVRVGQQFILRVEADRLHPSERFNTIDREWEGFRVTELPQQEVQRDDQSRQILSWSVVALQKGQQSFELPAIERRGRGRWRFYLPRIPLRVRPVPAYLPPGTPVGELALHSEITQQDGLPHWRIEAVTDAPLNPRRGLIELQGQINQWAAQNDLSDQQVKPQMERSLTEAGIQTRITYNLPVPEGAVLATHEFTQSVYSPKAGTWQQIRHSLPRATHLSGLQQGLILLFSLILLGLIGYRRRVWMPRIRQFGRLLMLRSLMITNPHSRHLWPLYKRVAADTKGPEKPAWLGPLGDRLKRAEFARNRARD